MATDIKKGRCHRCASVDLPFPVTHEVCRLCANNEPQFARAMSLGNYEGLLRQAVFEVKRASGDALALQMGRLLADLYHEVIADLGVEVIVPIPIYWAKRLRRGRNAAEWIARGLSSELRARYHANARMVSALRCTRRTKKQATLTTKQRKSNVENAYQVSRMWQVSGKRVLLVDDVMTSCSTMNEVTRIIKSAGAETVFVAVLARGVRHE